MTKNTAVADFKAFILPGVIKWFGENDKVAIRTAWGDWTDSLCKSNQITLRQYETWTNPFN
jgi:hypothetical protein